jgi:hypothetical protein
LQKEKKTSKVRYFPNASSSKTFGGEMGKLGTELKQMESILLYLTKSKEKSSG